MVDKGVKSVVSSFFSSNSKTDTPKTDLKQRLNCVDLGGQTDSSFRSAAAAMIDNILLIRSRGNEDLAKRLLKMHVNYFEQVWIQSAWMTYTEILVKLLEPIAVRVQFIHELAYVLRQETVSEMLRNPERYRFAFLEKQDSLGIEAMRQQSMSLHESALAALSKVTEVSVELHEVEFNKEGQMLKRYTVSADKPLASPIVLLRRGHHYYALLNQVDYFLTLNRERIEPVYPKVKSLLKDPSLTAILDQIADDDQRLFHEYQKIIKCLNIMLQAGELSEEKLMNIYITSLEKTKQEEQARYIGIEHGSQHLFDKMESVWKMDEAQQGPISTPYGQLTEELVRALARGVSTEQIDPSLIFDLEEGIFPKPK